MNWIDEPATWKQLKYLRQHGYKPDHRLTKSEASLLVSRYGGVKENQIMEEAICQPVNAYYFRTAVENAKKATAGNRIEQFQRELASATAQRQEFWLDTCRGATKIKPASAQVMDLCRKQGCLFCEPTHKQIQDILDAIDSAMPLWDRDHPELFYQALGLNFPELVRHQPGGLESKV